MCHPSPCTSRNHDGTLSGILPDDFDIHPSKTCVYTVIKTQDSYIFILKAWRVFAFQICLSKLSNLYPSLPKKNKKVWRFGLLCSTHLHTQSTGNSNPKKNTLQVPSKPPIRWPLEGESKGPRVRFTSFSSSFRPLDLATEKGSQQSVREGMPKIPPQYPKHGLPRFTYLNHLNLIFVTLKRVASFRSGMFLVFSNISNSEIRRLFSSLKPFLSLQCGKLDDDIPSSAFTSLVWDEPDNHEVQIDLHPEDNDNFLRLSGS